MRRPLSFALSFGTVLLIACSGAEPEENDSLDTEEVVSTEASACIADHPPSEPFDMGDSEGAAPTLAGVVEECHSGNGTGCDAALISKEAARCIAQNENFEAGLDAWKLGLTYEVSYHRLVWGIENLLVDNGAAGYSGKSLTLDATTGRVLGRTGWSAQ